MFPTINLPLHWLIRYDDYNKKIRNPDYAYGYNIQTAKYLQNAISNDHEGFIKIAQRNDKNLIATEPTTLY